MSKLVLMVLFLLLVQPFSYAQLPDRERTISRVDTYPIGGSLRIDREHPLIIIGSLETNLPSLIMDPENIQIVKTYQEPAEIKYFGDKGVNGVLVGELKTKIPLLKLDEVLDYFEVPPANRHLPIMVDRNLVDPELLLADVHRIKKIEVFEVTQQDVLSSLVYNHWIEVVGEKYLNIITAED
jgi:hypothetical protein